jgi:hypothetical protein
MVLKGHFNRLAISLFMMVLFYAGIQLAVGQDSDEIWEDSDTGLIWTVEDSGSDSNWSQAQNYCESLTLGGHTDWRLPTIDELKGLYDRSLSKQYKAKGPINLGAASVWSATRNKIGDAWSFNFGYGGTTLSPTSGCSASGRTLCTCGPGSE